MHRAIIIILLLEFEIYIIILRVNNDDVILLSFS